MKYRPHFKVYTVVNLLANGLLRKWIEVLRSILDVVYVSKLPGFENVQGEITESCLL